MLLKATEVCKAICSFTKSWILTVGPKDGLQGTQESPDTECNRIHVYASFWEESPQRPSGISKVYITQGL